MSETAILVQSLGKEYHIGGAQRQFNNLGEKLIDSLSTPFRRAGRLLRGQASGAAELDETIWALKDISFKIKLGEVVGVIGSNGAGKSTLLKILSRITEPSEGFADIYGRVGSLLEVGTGFHPELTGRENIYLNGAILGMKKAEIDLKFDEIVRFAEIGKFIETPVKHYSSGMYVRLAFAVAAHLDPEILLVDEVLAVGDIAFQRKCLGKMDDVAQQGRTVLFVSHNMGLIQTLCQRGIFLREGMIAAEGPVVDVIQAYLSTLEQLESQAVLERTDRRGRGRVRIVNVDISAASQEKATTLLPGKPVRFTFDVSEVINGMTLTFVINDYMGRPVCSFKSAHPGSLDIIDPSIGSRFICDIDELHMLPGRYRVDVSIVGGGELQDAIQSVAYFDVEEGQVDQRPVTRSRRVSVYIPHHWTLPNILQ